MDTNILEWHYVITGTKGSPYEGGHYHGKLKFPPEVCMYGTSRHAALWYWSLKALLLRNAPRAGFSQYRRNIPPNCRYYFAEVACRNKHVRWLRLPPSLVLAAKLPHFRPPPRP